MSGRKPPYEGSWREFFDVYLPLLALGAFAWWIWYLVGDPPGLGLILWLFR